MSEPKFTPGPWRLRGETIEPDGLQLRVWSDLGVINWFEGRREQDALPDAHLIAAAPDLYEALSTLAHAVVRESSNGLLRRMAGKALGTLAKARGEQEQ